MSGVLRPEVLSWKRPEARPERRPWLMEDEDPEQLARESIAGMQEAWMTSTPLELLR